MGTWGIGHWLVLAVVVVLLFGGGRFSNLMGDVAKGIKQFKKGMAEEDEPASAPPPRIDGRPAVPGETIVTPEAERARDR